MSKSARRSPPAGIGSYVCVSSRPPEKSNVDERLEQGLGCKGIKAPHSLDLRLGEVQTWHLQDTRSVRAGANRKSSHQRKACPVSQFSKTRRGRLAIYEDPVQPPYQGTQHGKICSQRSPPGDGPAGFFTGPEGNPSARRAKRATKFFRMARPSTSNISFSTQIAPGCPPAERAFLHALEQL